eukprot:gene57433-biopygen28340
MGSGDMFARTIARSAFAINDDVRDVHGEAQRDGRTIVFTDGAATNNQDERFRRAGYGAYWGPAHPLNIGALLKGSNQGNNAAELQAVIAALQADPRPLEIRSDSDHVCNGANRDRHRWRETGWRPKKLATAEICNADRWRQLDEIIQNRGEGRDLIVRVKGHTRQDQGAGSWMTPFFLEERMRDLQQASRNWRQLEQSSLWGASARSMFLAARKLRELQRILAKSPARKMEDEEEFLAFLDSWANPPSLGMTDDYKVMGDDFPHKNPGALRMEVRDGNYRIAHQSKYTIWAQHPSRF